MLLAELFIGGTGMEEQQNSLTYEIIKAAVSGERWATEKVIAHYDSYIEEPVSYTHLDVYKRQLQDSTRCPSSINPIT